MSDKQATKNLEGTLKCIDGLFYLDIGVGQRDYLIQGLKEGHGLDNSVGNAVSVRGNGKEIVIRVGYAVLYDGRGSVSQCPSEQEAHRHDNFSGASTNPASSYTPPHAPERFTKPQVRKLEDKRSEEYFERYPCTD